MKLRIYKRPQSKYYYALSASESLRVKFIGLAGLLSLIALVVGFYYFSSQSIFIAVLCLPLFVVIALYHAINYGLMLLYPGFDLRSHKKLVAEFKQRHDFPKIAVFIPAAGEDSNVVSRTVRAALKIDYPNYDVFVLDDSKNGMYKKMAAEQGAAYMRRRRVGHHKKAGNMNAALKRISGYSHILVLDADFVVRREILNELVPYAKDDVAIVQSPQHFELGDEVYDRSKVEFGAGMIQRDFYRITQVSRDKFGGAICVGTNALYSISALKQVGGYEGVGRAEWGHSEDVHTGLKMINAFNKQGDRYRIKYVPIQLATGICPADHLSFYKQQNRWATGSMQLIFSSKTLFSKVLSLPQRITYFSNSVYYFYTIGLLFAPLQLLILLLVPRTYDWTYTVLFLPMVFVTYILMPFLLRQKIEPIAASVVVISNAYTFAQALWLLLIRQPLGWEATGATAKAAKRNHQFRAMKFLSSGAFIAVYLLTLSVLTMNYKFGFNPSMFIVLVFLGSFLGHVIYLHHMLSADIQIKRLHVSRHAYGYVALAVLMLTTTLSSYSYSAQYDIKYEGGAKVALIATAPKTEAVPPETVQPQEQEVPVSPPSDISIDVAPGDSQSKIASAIAGGVRKSRTLDASTAGKLQDKLMHEMGYRDSISQGETYRFTQSDIDNLLNGAAYVYPHEYTFWAEYAGQAQVE